MNIPLAPVSFLAGLLVALGSQNAGGGPILYVTDHGEHTVSQIDLNTDQVTLIQVGGNPYCLTFNASKSILYVTKDTQENFSAIGTLTNTLFPTVPVPNAYAIAANGEAVYVTGFGGGTVWAFDPVTYTLLKAYTVPGAPNGIEVTPDGQRAFVPLRGAGLSIVDLHAGDVETKTEGFPYHVNLRPNSNQLWISNNGRMVTVRSTVRPYSILAQIDSGSDALAYSIRVSPDGQRAYLSHTGEDFVSIMDTNSQSLQYILTVGENPYGIAFSDDSHYAYVVLAGPGAVAVIDNQAVPPALIRTIPVGGTPSPSPIAVAFKNDPTP
jgi:YVTN family beta-propeller protein